MEATNRPNDGSRLCPMCGTLVATAYRECPSCGEPMLPPLPVTLWWDVALAMGVGGLSVAICGYWVGVASQASGGFPYERELPTIIASVITFWLWGPPLFAVVAIDPKRPPKGLPVSRWRQFWQMQGIMYGISIAFFFLCLATCATR